MFTDFRLFLSLSFLSCLVVSTLLMYSWVEKRGLSSKHIKQERKLASIGGQSIENPSEREISHSEIHHLIYNVLKSQYGVYLRENQVYQLELSQDLNPVPVPSLKDFLYKHHHLFKIPSTFNLQLNRSSKALPKRNIASSSALKVKNIRHYEIWHGESGKYLGHILSGQYKRKQVLLKVFIKNQDSQQNN